MRTFLFTFEALLVWKPPWKHWIKICSGKTFKIRRLSEIIYFHWRVAENPIFCWERGEEKKKKSQLFWILGQLFSTPSGTAQSNLNGYLRNEVRMAPEAGGPLAMKTRAGGEGWSRRLLIPGWEGDISECFCSLLLRSVWQNSTADELQLKYAPSGWLVSVETLFMFSK